MNSTVNCSYHNVDITQATKWLEASVLSIAEVKEPVTDNTMARN